MIIQVFFLLVSQLLDGHSLCAPCLLFKIPHVTFFERIQIIITFMVVWFPFHLLRDDMSAYVLQTVDNKRKQLLAFDVVPYCPAKFGEVLLFETR